MDIFRIGLGAALVLMGRRLFWLFVGAVGFLVGLWAANEFAPTENQWILIVFGLSVGVLGALLAVFLQGLAVWVVGFAAGGYLAATLVSALGFELTGLVAWLPFVLGGIVGAALMGLLFDWALILLSVITGTTLIVQSLVVESQTSALLYLGLMIVGIVLQASQMRRERSARTA